MPENKLPSFVDFMGKQPQGKDLRKKMDDNEDVNVRAHKENPDRRPNYKGDRPDEDIEESQNPREMTERLIGMMDDGSIEASRLVVACLNYMSEDDVVDMVNSYDIIDV